MYPCGHSLGVQSDSVAAALVPTVTGEHPAAVLLVDLSSQCVVHANTLAGQLAPGVPLPAAVDAWSDAAGLRDLDGQELTETSHPLSLAAEGLVVPGQAVTALRSSDVSERREPLFAVGLPLADAPGLSGHALLVLIPMHDEQAVDRAEQLARSQARVRERAVLATGISFTIADATAPDQPLVWVNPAFTVVTGYTSAEVAGRNCRFLQGPDTDPAAVAQLRRAVTAGHEVSLTLLNYRKDGTAFWNHLALSPVRDSNGTLTHIVGVQSDVTTRVEAERVREAALAAERRARADAEQSRADAEQARSDAEQARADAEQAQSDAEQAQSDAEQARADAEQARAAAEQAGARLASAAVTLQQGLLPTLPTLPDLHLAARYLPARQDSQVGGDWWDVFALPDGATALAIGDVMGHDLAAAAAMGQLRSVLRTCAWNSDGPATVLDRMDQLVQGFDMAQLATCIYARLSTSPAGHARLQWASAGHLPPVLMPAAGPARLLHAPTGVPLGAPGAQARVSTEVEVAAGDTLLLFTDGLVETRRGDIDVDLAHLLAAVTRHDRHHGPEVLVDQLIAGRTDLTDDVALLAVHIPLRHTTPKPWPRPVNPAEHASGHGSSNRSGKDDVVDVMVLPAEAASIPAARRHVTARCRFHALPDGLVDDAVLITSELVTNAVLHGRSTVTVKVHITAAALRVEIDDDNTRHPQLQAQDHEALDGRGLHIVDTLASRWGVTDHHHGKSVWFELLLPSPGR